MREIKFRAWDEKTRAFIYRLGHWDDNINMLNLSEDLASVSGWPNLILMQYTGLKDKNGIEIFEGDILAVNNEPLYKVEWANHMSMFDLVKLDGSGSSTDDMWLCEVIGNIYENPDLLETNK